MPKPIPGLIPEISRERVLELYKRIKPVKYIDGGYREIIGWHNFDGSQHRFAEKPDDGLFKMAFLVDPLLGDKIHGLKKCGTVPIWSYTGYAHPVFLDSYREGIRESLRRKRIVELSNKDLQLEKAVQNVEAYIDSKEYKKEGAICISFAPEEKKYTGPAISQIFAQIPKSFIDSIVGFEVNTKKISRHPDSFYQYHCAETVLLKNGLKPKPL